jgi:hypothetical protein
MAGSLLNPASASSGSNTPVRLRARIIRMAVKSIRIHSVNSRMTDPIRMISKVIWLGSIPINVSVNNEAGLTLLLLQLGL